MSEYVLAKEVPFCEVGAQVRFNDQTRKFEAYSNYWKAWVTFSDAYGYINLVDGGWIEEKKEVKPREFIIELGKDGRFLSFSNNKGYMYDSNKIDVHKEVIKVREVL